MVTKREDILALLDKAIGKKGPLRLPAYWMREVLLMIMDWAEGLTPDVDVPTKISQLENDAKLATQSYVNASINSLNSSLNSAITSLETKTKKIGTESYKNYSNNLTLNLSGQYGAILNVNMIPDNHTVNISNTSFDGCSYKILTVARNVSFTCASNNHKIINPYFACDDYSLCEFSFTVSDRYIFITRSIIKKVNLIKITPSSGGFYLLTLRGIANSPLTLLPSWDGKTYFTTRSGTYGGYYNCVIPCCGYLLTDKAEDITYSYTPDFGYVKEIEYTEGFTYAENFLNEKFPTECTIVFPETFKRFEGNLTFKNAQNVTLDFTNSKEVVELDVYNQNWLTFVVSDGLYDEWITANNWSQMATQIKKASEYY